MAIESQNVCNHFDEIAREYDGWKQKADYYYREVMAGIREFIPQQKRVLEIGCATGSILASLSPSFGLGIDLSPKMIEAAKVKHPTLQFSVGNIETFSTSEVFDFIVMVDLVEHLPSLEKAFRNLQQLAAAPTKVVISSANPLWAPILHLAERLKLKMPEGDHRWPSAQELLSLANRFGFKLITVQRRMLVPKKMAFISDALNRLVLHLPVLFSKLCLIQIMVLQAKERHAS